VGTDLGRADCLKVRCLRVPRQERAMFLNGDGIKCPRVKPLLLQEIAAVVERNAGVGEDATLGRLG
jgi:hypothetical protein